MLPLLMGMKTICIVTRIEIFGDDGEIFACRFKGDGATAELIFEQIDLQLETIMGEEE